MLEYALIGFSLAFGWEIGACVAARFITKWKRFVREFRSELADIDNCPVSVKRFFGATKRKSNTKIPMGFRAE